MMELMDAKRQDRESSRRASRDRVCISVFWIFYWLSMSPLWVLAQDVGQAGPDEPAQLRSTIRRDASQSALQLLADGNIEDALKVLEPIADSPSPIALSDEDLVAQACAGLNRLLAQRQSDERYELLSHWSISTAPKSRVRLLTALVPTLAPPSEFARFLGERPRPSSFPVASIGGVRGLYCTAWELVVAARESGRLKRLMTEVRPLIERKTPNAELLFSLALIAEGKGETTFVADQLVERTNRMTSSLPASSGSQIIDMDSIVLAIAASQQPPLRPLARNLLEALLASTAGQPDVRVRSFLQHALTSVILLNQGDGIAERLTSCPFKYWLPVAGRIGSRSLWQPIEDHIAHLSGADADALLFRYPLQGDFEFHCDMQSDGGISSDGALIYGGLQFRANSANAEFLVRGVDAGQVTKHSWPFIHVTARPTFNRLSVMTSSSLKVAVNLHPTWTDTSVSRTSPWLGLSSLDGNRSLFRNLKLSGAPSIPRAVRMSDGDLLRGWQSSNSGWRVRNGVIQFAEREAGTPADDAEQHLSYHRPLLRNESVDFEFFYHPDTTAVSPTLGRVAFLLQPDGVRLHWVTDGDLNWTGLGADNAVTEPLNRRGPKPLPLKRNDWNHVNLALTEQFVTISLNGVTVYQRPIDVSADHRFGFYHHQSIPGAMIRNVVMTGDWPETLPQEFLDNPMLTAAEPVTVADRRVLSEFFPDEVLAENVLAVRRRALAMSLEGRLEYLSEWILPGPNHPGFRIAGEFTPTRPSPLAIEPGLVHPELGGQIVSPIFEWLDTARELGRLAKCRQTVEAIPTSDDEFQRRAKVSLLLLIDLEEHEPLANDRTWETLFGLLKNDEFIEGENRWPEMLLAVRGAEKFPHSKMHYDLISDLVLHRMLRWKRPDITRWHNHLASLYRRDSLRPNMVTTAEPETSTALHDWIPVAAGQANTFGSGYPNLSWSRLDDRVVKASSHDADYLYYRSPLCGNFEVEADLVQPAEDPVAIMVAGSYVGPLGGMNGLDNGSFRAASPPILFQQPFRLTNVGKSAHFRAKIHDGTRTIYINGRQVLDAPLTPGFDPWIAVRSSGRHRSSVKNLRIMGEPKVLEAVTMSNASDLTGWLNYHEEGRWESVVQKDLGNWIIDNTNPALSGAYAESLLRYQRPLVEDGSIEYEFYYDPGVAEVHPALDRLAFVLNPDGVREHWITDGRHDRTELAPDNLMDVPANKRGLTKLPLISGDWNRLRLALHGATVSVELNRTHVYERHLESANQRAFGLFHYADRTSAQVRNVVMRGTWPATVPVIAQQELAGKTAEWLDRDLPRLKSVFKYDFAKEGLSERYFEFAPGIATTPTAEGLGVAQSSTKDAMVWEIFARFAVSGDFDTEATFAKLQVENCTSHCGIILRAIFAEPETPVFDLQRYVDQVNRHFATTSRWLAEPTIPGRHLSESETMSWEAPGGRLRMARRGNQLHYLIAENDSTNFQLIDTRVISQAPTLSTGIRLLCVDYGGENKVIWKDLTVRAERMTWHPGLVKNNIALLKVVQADGSGIRTIIVPSSVGFRYAGSPEWSADGRKILVDMLHGQEPGSHIFVTDSDGTNLTDLGRGSMPSFSPDGSRIVFSHQGVMTMKSDGTDRQVVDAGGWGAQWSPDGKWIAYGKNGNIMLLNVETQKTGQLLTGSTSNRYSRIYWNLAWSHDSRAIAFKAILRTTGGDELAIAEVDAADGWKVLRSDASDTLPDITFSPDNEQVIAAIAKGGNPLHKLYAIDRQKPEMAVLLDAIPPSQVVDGVAWSRDGKRIAIVALETVQPTEWTADMKSDDLAK